MSPRSIRRLFHRASKSPAGPRPNPSKQAKADDLGEGLKHFQQKPGESPTLGITGDHSTSRTGVLASDSHGLGSATNDTLRSSEDADAIDPFMAVWCSFMLGVPLSETETPTIVPETEHLDPSTLAAKNGHFYPARLSKDHIRLVTIDPGQYDDPISCGLNAVSLQSALVFNALSYCWDPCPCLETIKVNGEDGFSIDEHLLQALRRLRLASTNRCVWIDALCINQADEAEKSQQVAIMRNIYSKSQQTLIWLGETEFFGPYEKNCRLRPDGFCTERGLRAATHGNMTKVFNEKIGRDEMCASGGKHHNRVWWKRLWVVQEYAFSTTLPHVMIGSHTISWAFFATLQWHKNNPNHLFFRLKDRRELQRQALWDLLLMTTKDFSCSDPRDRIYALLGLVNDKDIPLVVDYSISIDQLYSTAAVYMIQKHRTLDVIVDRGSHGLRQTESTWVPDMTTLRYPDLTRTPDRYDAFNLDPVIALMSTGNNGQTKLKVRGVRFDRVVSKISGDTIQPPVHMFCTDDSEVVKVISELDMCLSAHVPADDSKYREARNALGWLARRNLGVPAAILNHLQVDIHTESRFQLDRSPQVAMGAKA